MGHNLYLSFILGWQDIRQSYRRSKIGQFWITLGMAVQILSIGVVFGMIFKTPIETYLPFLTVSTVLFSLFSQMLTEGVGAFPANDQMIRQLNLPAYVHVFRTSWKAFLTFAHNLVIVPIVFLCLGKSLSFTAFLFFPGLVVAVANLMWMAKILALVAARYRDVVQIVGSLVTVLYYVTPVMWQPSSLPSGMAHILLGLNPFYHLLQITRLPFFGEAPTIENWIVTIGMLGFGWLASNFLYKRHASKIALWL
jgi:lipopolysaccharide transport system permease protein